MVPLCPSCGTAKWVVAAGPDCGRDDPMELVGLAWICRPCEVWFVFEQPTEAEA